VSGQPGRAPVLATRDAARTRIFCPSATCRKPVPPAAHNQADSAGQPQEKNKQLTEIRAQMGGLQSMMLPMPAMLVAGYIAKQDAATAPFAPEREGLGGLLGGLFGSQGGGSATWRGLAPASRIAPLMTEAGLTPRARPAFSTH
jgi:hypothetical protein